MCHICIERLITITATVCNHVIVFDSIGVLYGIANVTHDHRIVVVVVLLNQYGFTVVACHYIMDQQYDCEFPTITSIPMLFALCVL